MNKTIKLVNLYLPALILTNGSVNILTQSIEIDNSNEDKIFITNQGKFNTRNSQPFLKTHTFSRSAFYDQTIAYESFKIPKNSRKFLIKNFTVSYILNYEQLMNKKPYENKQVILNYEISPTIYYNISQNLQQNGAIEVQWKSINHDYIGFKIANFTNEAHYFNFPRGPLSTMITTAISKANYSFEYEYETFSDLSQMYADKIFQYLNAQQNIGLTNLNNSRDLITRLESRLKRLTSDRWKSKLKIDLYNKNYDQIITNYSRWEIEVWIDNYRIEFDNKPYVTFEIKNVREYHRQVLLINNFFTNNNWVTSISNEFQNLDFENKTAQFKEIFHTNLYENDVLAINSYEILNQSAYQAYVEELIQIEIAPTNNFDGNDLKINIFTKQDNQYIGTLLMTDSQ